MGRETLYVSDLDGTLLDGNGSLSGYSRKTLEELLGEGLLFTVASARNIVSIRQTLCPLPLTLPVIGFNGAFFSDLRTGDYLLVNNIGNGNALDLLRMVLDHGLSPFISTHDGERDRLYYQEAVNEGMRLYLEERRNSGDPRLSPVKDLAPALSQKVVGFAIMGRQEELAPLEKAIGSAHRGRIEAHSYEDIYYPGWHWLTVTDHRATKGEAIRTFRDQFGFQDKEIVVFGDHANDILMFKAADRCVAVGNATTELKALAHEVIGPNHQDSVVRFIERDFRSGRP